MHVFHNVDPPRKLLILFTRSVSASAAAAAAENQNVAKKPGESVCVCNSLCENFAEPNCRFWQLISPATQLEREEAGQKKTLFRKLSLPFLSLAYFTGVCLPNAE